MALFREFLAEDGALVRGHFVYASDNHGEWYVNKTAGLVLASHATQYARRIAEIAWFDFMPIEAVVGPELGAISLMASVRDALYVLSNKEVAGIMATKIPGTKRFEIARDQARFIKGKRTLVVEDILTTGESAKNTADAVREAGGEPVVAVALWNRGGVIAAEIGVPELVALVDERIQTYQQAECPLCKAGVPINTDLGKGKEFLARKLAKA